MQLLGIALIIIFTILSCCSDSKFRYILCFNFIWTQCSDGFGRDRRKRSHSWERAMGGKQLMGLVTRGVVLLMLKLGVLGGSSHFELLVFVRGMLFFCNIFSCSSFDSLYIYHVLFQLLRAFTELITNISICWIQQVIWNVHVVHCMYDNSKYTNNKPWKQTIHNSTTPVTWHDSVNLIDVCPNDWKWLLITEYLSSHTTIKTVWLKNRFNSIQIVTAWIELASESVETVGSGVSQMSLFAMLVTEGVLGEWTTGILSPLFFGKDTTLVVGARCGEAWTAGLMKWSFLCKSTSTGGAG